MSCPRYRSLQVKRVGQRGDHLGHALGIEATYLGESLRASTPQI